MKTAIIGTGAFLPETIITNDDLSAIVDTNNEWIQSRTGIAERRVMVGGGNVDMCEESAKRALENAGITAKDIDLLIVTTLTGDYYCPSTACELLRRLGAECPAFDINAACSGFVYGLSVAKSMMESGPYEHVLLVSTEMLSRITDWEDRSTCVLFGDGSGAVVLAKKETGIIASVMGAYADDNGCLKVDGMSDISYADTEEMFKSNKIMRNRPKIFMNGREVFKFATRRLASDVNRLLDIACLKLSDISLIIPHQANRRIIEAAAKMLSLPIEKFYINLQSVGNMSCATIPVALDEACKKGLIKKGDKLIFAAFGGGLTSAAALVEWVY